jgi:hypothetical protein
MLLDRLRALLGTIDDDLYVRQDLRAMRRLAIRGMITALAGGGALGVLMVGPLPGPVHWIAVAVLLVVLGNNGYAGGKRAMAYRQGWVDGRQAMINSMSEAFERGMSPEEWADAEQVRTLAVLGLGITDSLGEQD